MRTRSSVRTGSWNLLDTELETVAAVGFDVAAAAVRLGPLVIVDESEDVVPCGIVLVKLFAVGRVDSVYGLVSLPPGETTTTYVSIDDGELDSFVEVWVCESKGRRNGARSVDSGPEATEGEAEDEESDGIAVVCEKTAA